MKLRVNLFVRQVDSCEIVEWYSFKKELKICRLHLRNLARLDARRAHYLYIQRASMLSSLLNKFRHHYHPFHRLKRNRFFSRFILPRLDRQIFRRLHGVDHPVSVRLMRHLSYIVDNRTVEPGIAALFISICKTFEIKNFWDVGANIGFYSWLVLSTQQKAKALLFEPDLENLSLIRQTISYNGITRADVIPKAVSHEIGTVDFKVDTISGFTGGIDLNDSTFIEKNYRLKQTKVIVTTTTLDSNLSNQPPPDLIKIDVEGAEHLVLEGAKQLLEVVRPIFIFECSLENFDTLTKRFLDNDYVLMSAEEPDAVFENTPNILAVPSNLAKNQKQLMSCWRKEFGNWINEVND